MYLAEGGLDLQVLSELFSSLSLKVGVELLAIPLAPLVAYWLRKAWLWMHGQTPRARLKRIRSALSSETGLWLTKPIRQPHNYELMLKASIPIITLANLKGGVGKTTISANLAAHCANQGERVLLIDLDYQGSLSSMVLGEARAELRPKPDEYSSASLAVLGSKDADWLIANAWPRPQAPSLFAITAFYDLGRVENRVMIEWLIKDRAEDMPNTLANLLHNPKVQSRYDRIIIDAPPRLTTACIQALCASTHVLIPTVLDALSAEAVTSFIEDLEVLKKNGLCPHIRHLGIVGSMMPAGNSTFVAPTVMALKERLADISRRIGTEVELLPEETWIRDSPSISRSAGLRLGYFDAPASDRNTIRQIFDSFGTEVRKRSQRNRVA